MVEIISHRLVVTINSNPGMEMCGKYQTKTSKTRVKEMPFLITMEDGGQMI